MLPILTVPALATLGHAAAKYVHVVHVPVNLPLLLGLFLLKWPVGSQIPFQYGNNLIYYN